MILTIRTYVASKISLDEIVLYCVLKFPIFFLHNGWPIIRHKKQNDYKKEKPKEKKKHKNKKN